MSTVPQNPEYIRYQDYNGVKEQYDRILNIKNDDERFENIIKDITKEKYKSYLNNDTLKKLHNVLSNYSALSSGIKHQYCSYINHWLNKEVQNTNNDVNSSYFNIFNDFSEKLSYIKTGKTDQLCKGYFFDLGDETINKMKFLYRLYDAYNKIKSRSKDDMDEGCGKLDLLSLIYRRSIYDYYVKNEDKDLYNKLEYIIKEIDKITGIKTTSPCKQKIYFTKPTKLENLLEEKRKEAAEVAARLAKEEEARQAKEKEARQAKEKEARQTKEEEARQHPDILSGSSHNSLQEILHENRELPSTSYQTGSQGFVTSRLYSQGERFDNSEWIESPTGSLLEKGYTPRRPTEYTLEEREQQSGLDQEQGDKGTTRPGTSFGSSGFPGYITDVFRSVEPAPILGVSGGMGALFLLFKYTPVGSFFGGRRGRFRQIPRTFGGFTPGEFPNFQEYDGGSIGYSPMGISPFAE